MAARLADARARWAACGLHDYTFRYTLTCFCDAGTWLVHVSNDRYVSAEPVGETRGETVGSPTVPALFDMVERALARAGSITVSYDTALGYPQIADIDWITNAVDDEDRFEVGTVTAI